MTRKPGTVTYVKKAIARNEHRATQLKGEDNPQLVKMRIQAEAKAEILRNVLDSLQGYHVNLRIEAGE